MKIESLPLHPRNKILLYSRYLHAKLSWDLTVADIDKTCIVNNICRQFVRRWLEIPPSGTLDLILLSGEKFGLEVADVSTKLQQCKATVRNVSDPHRTSIFSSWPAWQMQKQSNIIDSDHQKKCLKKYGKQQPAI